MSDLDTIRTLTADAVRYDRATFTGDGLTVEFILPNSPLVTGSQTVTVDGAEVSTADYTIDNALGLIVMAFAPALNGAGVVTYKHSILSDDQLQSLLDLEDDVRLAAADALDIIASSEALIQKQIKILDLETNGPALAAAFRKHAETLRKQVYDIEMNESTFDIVEQVNDTPGFREKVIKNWMRQT